MAASPSWSSFDASQRARSEASRCAVSCRSRWWWWWWWWASLSDVAHRSRWNRWSATRIRIDGKTPVGARTLCCPYCHWIFLRVRPTTQGSINGNKKTSVSGDTLLAKDTAVCIVLSLPLPLSLPYHMTKSPRFHSSLSTRDGCAAGRSRVSMNSWPSFHGSGFHVPSSCCSSRWSRHTWAAQLRCVCVCVCREGGDEGAHDGVRAGR